MNISVEFEFFGKARKFRTLRKNLYFTKKFILYNFRTLPRNSCFTEIFILYWKFHTIPKNSYTSWTGAKPVSDADNHNRNLIIDCTIPLNHQKWLKSQLSQSFNQISECPGYFRLCSVPVFLVVPTQTGLFATLLFWLITISEAHFIYRDLLNIQPSSPSYMCKVNVWCLWCPLKILMGGAVNFLNFPIVLGFTSN